MKLSVIVPCFNAASRIGTQLNALSQQSWHHEWEVVVVDNGSTDKTLEVVEQYLYKFSNLKAIKASEKRGASYARNQGVNKSEGDLIVFCDADDQVGSHWLSNMGNALLKHHFVAGSRSYLFVNPDWRIQRGYYQVSKSELERSKHKPYLPYAPTCNLGIRRELHYKAGGFDEELFGAQDADYCFRVQLLGVNLVLVPEVVVYYRLRDKLSDNYRQGLKYAKANLFLYKKWGNPVSCLTRLRFLLGGWRHTLAQLLTVRNRTDLCEFFWRLGWQVGEVIGCLTYLC